MSGMNPDLSDSSNLANAQMALESGNVEMAVRHILEYLVKKEPKAKDNTAEAQRR